MPESPLPNRASDNGTVLPGGHAFHEGAPLRENMAKLRRYAWAVVAAGLLGLGIAFWRVHNERPRYRAVAVVRLTREQAQLPPELDAASDAPLGYGNDWLLSQLEVLRSRGIAGEVVDSTGLQLQVATPGVSRSIFSAVSVSPEASDTLTVEFRARTVHARRGRVAQVASYGQPLDLPGVRFTVDARPSIERALVTLVPREDAIDRLLDNLGARPRDPTNVVDLTYTALDPWLAQQVVNRVALTFHSLSAHAAQQSARRRREFVREQLAETDSLLASAQLALSDFRRREQLYSSRERFSARQTGLMEIDMRREELVADRGVIATLLGRIEQAEEPAAALRTVLATPAVADNLVIKELYGRLVEHEARLDSLTTGAFASARTHPDVQRLRTLAAETRVQLADAIRGHLTAIDARIAALTELRGRYAAEMEGLPEVEAEEARLVQNLETLRRVSDMMREELQRARIAEAVEGGYVEIVDLATRRGSRLPSGRTRTLLLGLVLGLIGGAAGAILYDNLNTAIRRKEDLEAGLQVPGLGVIPRIGAPRSRFEALSLRTLLHRNGTRAGARNGAGRSAATLVALRDRHSNAAEAYRTLRTNLIFSQAVKDFHRIVITSSGPAEGKTTTAANLAITFAQQGLHVLLADCDLRRPQLHVEFDVTREPGLTDRLIGRATTEQVVRATEIERLSVLPSGIVPPNPSELLGGGAMDALLDELSGEYDIILLDTPPLLAAADAAVLAADADGVLLVVRAGSTRREEAEAALRQLRNVGARVIGGVLNDPDANLPKYGEHYHYAYYGSDAYGPR